MLPFRIITIAIVTHSEAERKVQEERIRMENILSGNPLLNSTKAEFKVKRRWDDDVVFKNCAKGDLEGSKERHFINDTLRSEFHKKFMEKYIKEGFLDGLADEWLQWIGRGSVHPSRMDNKVLAVFMGQQMRKILEKMASARI
ncbi:hypothetical protein HPB47_014535 [Ixodes persulcatus]|uniref:Uncharacterized protein n=1 Tax=Ixodes persulcatus TaxID=34615 RepID=A0AC60QX50_IXOPE|nr:hypothetical protein HPB47_014535 [Ixodes persulcatus]